MSMPAASTKTTKLATSLIDEDALLGWRAMLTEVNLSPKPGLVDRINCGAHKDMALGIHRRRWRFRAGYPVDRIGAGSAGTRSGTQPGPMPNWYGLRR